MTISEPERERALVALREHHVAGSLTLEDFADRVGIALRGDIATALRDLPAPSRRKPTRFVPALFSSTRRDGRMRIRRRILCLVACGNIDLDLRQASLEGDVVTVIGFAVCSALDVYVPEGVEVDLHGLGIFGHKNTRGKDVPPLPGTPLIRVYTLGVCAGIDVWRTSERGSIREVIRTQRELDK
ncbi:MAG: DUF1707 domain-containing protein [Gaiellaceae bacterium]